MSKTKTKTSEQTNYRYTIYTIPRKFRDGAKLQPLLAEKTPDMVNMKSNEYTLLTVLSALRQVISGERLFDPSNTTVIMCSPELEEALNMKSLHVTEVRDLVILQMEVVSVSMLASLAPPPPNNQQCQQGVVGNTGIATAVGNTAGGGQTFDTEGQYWVKPLFLQVLRMVRDVPSNKVVFSYREVTSYLSQYILERQNKFFDQRNIKVAHVEGDPLGTAFSVKVFHRTQVTALLRKQLIPFKPSNGEKTLKTNNPDQNSAPKILRFASLPGQNELHIGRVATSTTSASNPSSAIDQSLDKIASSRKRTRESLENSADATKDEALEKEDTISPPRRVRRRSSISITFVKDNRDSDDETIYSAQGYDTNVADDQDQEEEEEMSDHDFDVYNIEYTPESDDDDEPTKKGANDAESGNSDESDIDEAIIVATAFELLNTDQSYDEEADESSDDDDTDDDTGFDGFDPENSDVWKCLECKQPNTPYIRYCSACYKERKGWLPERPKPKKKKVTTGDLKSNSPLKKISKSAKASKKGMSMIKSSSLGAVNEVKNLARTISETSEVAIAGSSKDLGSAGASSSQDSGFSELTQTEAESQSIESEVGSSDENEVTAQKAGSSKSLGKFEKDLLKKGFSISSSNPSMLCTLCCSQPKNACLVHGRISHQVCCYSCAKKLFKSRKPCPVCRRRVEKITKNIIA